MTPERRRNRPARLQKVDGLVRWWRAEGRRYPWRKTRNPFRILIAEILLHRTRADQVLPVYRHLIALSPSPRSLLEHETEARHLLEPLGLQWRTDLLFRMATDIVRAHGGRVPESRDQLTRLPGVGDYITGAVRCFSSNSPEILLDTNIVRVIGRAEGYQVNDSSRRSRAYRKAAESWIRYASPRETYFAIIDLAARVCVPHNPLCGDCPIAGECRYAQVHQVAPATVQNRPGSGFPSRSVQVTQVAGATLTSRPRQRPLSIAPQRMISHQDV